MATSNDVIAQRADLALADFSGGTKGGLLNPEQANAFIDFVQEQPTILNQARIIRMNAPQRHVDRIGFGERIMRAAPQGTSPFAADDGTNDRHLAAADRAAPTTNRITLTTKEVMAEVHIPYEVFEDNIERGGLEDRLMMQIAERAAIDLEEWMLEADTGSGDAYLALTDGILKQATSNIVDFGGTAIDPDLFTDMMLAMPQKYLRNLNTLKHWITVADSIRYRSNVAKRATGYGDSSLTSNNELFAFGVQVESAPMMPAAYGLFTFPQNIVFGIQRQVSVETDKDIRARTIIVVLTARVDVKIDLEEAVVKAINISGAIAT